VFGNNPNASAIKLSWRYGIKRVTDESWRVVYDIKRFTGKPEISARVTVAVNICYGRIQFTPLYVGTTNKNIGSSNS